MRNIIAPLVLTLCLGSCSVASAQPSRPIVVAAADDAGSSAHAKSSPPITVDPSTGVVTPAPGTLPDVVTGDPVGFARWMVEALRGGNWRLAAAGLLAALMVLGVRLRVRLFGTTDRGKALAVMTLALLGTLSASLAGIVPMSLQLFVGAVTVAFTAVGGRQWLSRLLWPRDGGRQWLPWLMPWLGVTDAAPTPTPTPSSLPSSIVA